MISEQHNEGTSGAGPTAGHRAAASWGMAAADPPRSPQPGAGGDRADREGAAEDSAGRARRVAEDGALARAEAELLAALDLAWSRGWLPGEVIRQIARTRSPAAARLTTWAVAADHAGRPPATLHPRWAGHLRTLDLPVVPGPTGWLRGGLGAVGLDAAEGAALARVLAQAVTWLHGLGVVVPPPGSPGASPSVAQSRARAEGRQGLDPVLDKVRALLAQAESTTFEAEAETFTAKAQELMARHAIDAALVWGAATDRDEPGLIRIPVEEPYLTAKTVLLQVVARSCRCSAVYYKGYALAVVVGYEADLVATETLYTSLLVQAQIFLQQEAAGSRPGDHVRSRGFRSAFLYAFAQRIGLRLTEVARQVEAEAAAASGGDLLPVLADRGARIEAKITAELGPVRRSRANPSLDAHGWRAGARAADRARLGDRDELGRADRHLPPGPNHR